MLVIRKNIFLYSEVLSSNFSKFTISFVLHKIFLKLQWEQIIFLIKYSKTIKITSDPWPFNVTLEVHGLNAWWDKLIIETLSCTGRIPSYLKLH